MASEIRKKPFMKISILFCILAAVTVFFLAVIWKPKAQREDYRRISSLSFDTAFLSMYPIDTYQEEPFSAYRGMTVFKASYCIPKTSVLKQYMKRIARSGNTISTVYLGIRPDLISPEELRPIFELYPSVTFEIILSYPSADYWKDLSVEEYERTLNAYNNFLAAAPGLTANTYFIGSQEWLIANPGNYEEEWLVNESIAQTIMLHCDILHEYFITNENVERFSQELTALTRQIRTTTKTYPDLSDHCLVFFGDSVIGNYTDSASIPGVVNGLTNAAVFNFGYGGNSAALDPESQIALAGIAEAFVQGDLSVLPPDTQVYSGMASYLSASLEAPDLSIIIDYGLNDYFTGNPMSSEEDPYDITTYCGAIRTAVTAIRADMPDAQIIMCTPNDCFYFDEGMSPQGEEGYVLEDYANAVLALSEELQTDVLDIYHGFDINPDNWLTYLLPDQVHPNAAFRYLIGEKIVGLIR